MQIQNEKHRKIIENFLTDKDGYKCAARNNISISQIYRLLRLYNVPNRRSTGNTRKYECDDTYFDDIDSPNKAYIYGFLLADGCVVDNKLILKLSEKDGYMVEKINNLLQNGRPVRYVKNISCPSISNPAKRYQCKNAYELIVTSRNIYNKLNEYGLVPNKTDKIRFPTWMNKELISHFVRGFWDGDGTISIYKPSNKKYKTFVAYEVSFVMKNEIFCDELKKFLEIKLKIQIKKRKKNGIFELSILKNKEKKIFLDWIFQNKTLYLTRKYERYLQFLKYHNDHLIKCNNK